MAPRNNFFRAIGAASARAPENNICRIFGAKIIIKNFILTAAIVFCLPLVVAAQTFAKPGDTGSIKFPIYSDVTSFEAAEGVRILTEAPSFFIVKNTSILGPSPIQPAGTKNFVVDYEIGSDAQDGPFEVVLNVNMDSLNVYPDTDTLTSVVDFTRNFLFSLVGNHTVAFFQSLVAKPVKFATAQTIASQAQGEDSLLCGGRPAAASRYASTNKPTAPRSRF